MFPKQPLKQISINVSAFDLVNCGIVYNINITY